MLLVVIRRARDADGELEIIHEVICGAVGRAAGRFHWGMSVEHGRRRPNPRHCCLEQTIPFLCSL